MSSGGWVSLQLTAVSGQSQGASVAEEVGEVGEVDDVNDVNEGTT